MYLFLQDNHKYYISSYDSSGAKKWWYSAISKGESPAKIHENLSKNKIYSDVRKKIYFYCRFSTASCETSPTILSCCCNLFFSNHWK